MKFQQSTVILYTTDKTLKKSIIKKTNSKSENDPTQK